MIPLKDPNGSYFNEQDENVLKQLAADRADPESALHLDQKRVPPNTVLLMAAFIAAVRPPRFNASEFEGANSP